MDRPGTIIEVHREPVQDQTAGRFLRTNPNEGSVDNLDSLPECTPTPSETYIDSKSKQMCSSVILRL
jgi:hypothetical protein